VSQHDARSTTDPVQRLRSMIFGAIQGQAIGLAAELSLADRLRDGPLSLERLAAATGTLPAALERVLRLLVQMGVLAQTDAGAFALTDLGRPLQADAPLSLRNYARLSNSGVVMNVCAQLPASARTGASQFAALHGGTGFYEALQRMPAEAEVFNAAMHEISDQDVAAVRNHYDFGDRGTIVDVGGGQGHLLAALLDARPGLAGVLQDLPEVAAGAGAVLGRYMQGGRCRIVAGDFLAAVPPGGDIYVLKRVLSHCDDAQARTLLGHIRAGIAPGGRVLIADPDPDSLYGASFDVLMLVLLGGGLRTETQLRALFAQRGFRYTRAVDTDAELRLVEAMPA
jgi:hypothetical protein